MNLKLFKAPVAIALTSLLLSACGAQVTPARQNAEVSSEDLSKTLYSSFPSKIIGNSPLISVNADGSNIDANLRSSLDAFGIISINNQGACTGTHLGNGYVLTAGHCLLDESAPKPQKTANQSCSNIKIYWGFRGSPSNGTPKPIVIGQSQCTQVVYAELSADRDFGIFKVDQAPNAKIHASTSSTRATSGTRITIFGYPQARPLEWSQYCAVQNKNAAGLDGGPTSGQSIFVHQCDTQPGNSGSSIIAVGSNGLSVVGVHDGAAPSGVNYNYGTYMYDIRAILKTRGFDLDQATGTNSIFSAN